MSHARIALLLLITGLAFTTAPRAADPTAAERDSHLPRIQRLPIEQLSSRAAEIRGLTDQEGAALSALNQRLERSTSDGERRMVLQEIQDLKSATEKQILGVQLRHARSSGDAELIAALEAALEASQPEPPIDRTAPTRPVVRTH